MHVSRRWLGMWIAALICLAIVEACSPASSVPTEERDMASRPTLVIAHRGARSLAPENTLAAAQKALEVGADMWELDVAVTADGELVVVHDDTLVRTCDVQTVFPDRRPWQVWQFSLAEIQTLDCGSWFNQRDPFGQIKAGNVSAAELQSHVGQRAPTLRQALEFTREHHWRVNVELKEQPTPESGRIVVEKSVALIEELGMDDGEQAVVSSFEHEYLKSLKEMNSRIPVQVLLSQTLPDLPAYLATIGTDMCNPKVDIWSVQELSELSQQGIRFNVWTVNDEALMKDLIHAGVQGIITDYPQTLVVLKSQAKRG